MVWSEETIRLLRDHWAQGHSTAEIGRRLGVSKNAIVGKAHRLDLTARPSPIRRDKPGAAQERPQALPRVEGPTLPPLTSAALHPAFPNVQEIRPAQPAPMAKPVPGAVQAPRPLAVPAAVRAVVPPPMQQRRPAPSCCWPIGEPGKRDFRFCDDPSMPGKPYCGDHAKMAYVKIRDRKDDAA